MENKGMQGIGVILTDEGIKRMLQKSPEERLQMYREFLDREGLDTQTAEETLQGMVLCGMAARQIRKELEGREDVDFGEAKEETEDPWELTKMVDPKKVN